MITIQAQLDFFKQQFPQEKITSVQEREGKDHLVTEINHTWICKSAKTDEYIPLLKREVALLKMLQGKITTQIPEPLHYQDNILVYKKIPGSPLFSYMIHHLGNKQKAKLVAEIAQFLLELHHALSAEQIESLQLSSSDWPWSLETLQENRHYLVDLPEFIGLFDSLMKMYEASQDEITKTLIHHDFHLKNIIVDPLTGKLRGVIDFADVAYDDFALDLRIRRQAPVEFLEAVAAMYAMQGGTLCTPEKLYGYYFATEFSRYFQYRQEANDKEAQNVLYEIARVVENMAGTHQDCKESGRCMHTQQNQIEATI